VDRQGSWWYGTLADRYVGGVCASFLRSVISKRGCFVHVPTGRARDRPPPAVPARHWDGPEVLTAPSTPVNSEVVCPVLWSPISKVGADLCVAYGLASAVHHLGNRSAAAIIAACAAAAATSCEAIGYVRDVVNMDVAGSGTLAYERCRAFACGPRGPRRAAGAGESLRKWLRRQPEE